MLLLVAFTVRADDGQKLDEFLSRLGLTELRLVHMERLLSHEQSAEKRVSMARQLADAYAEELVSAADESERFAALKARVEKLLAVVPQASTPAVEIVLLQADYQRAETLIIHWLEEPSEKASLDEAAKILARIQPLLSARQAQLAAAADKAADAIDSIKNEQQRLAAEQQLRRQRAVAARADYFAGWAAYYLGVSRQNLKAAASEFKMAKDHFSRVLDVTDEKNYEPIEAEGLGLDSVWRSRCVIGLGLAELGLQHAAAAARIFRWLNHSSVPPAIRDQADYWHVQGMLNSGLLGEAARLVTTEVASFTGTPSSGKSSLCIAAIRAGTAPAASGGEDRRQLVEQGIRGLARMRQFETLDKLIERYKLDEGPEAGRFHLAWLRGRRQYLAGEKAKQADAFRAASATLSAALAQPEARTDLAEAGQARYYLAWCRYRLDDFDAAARAFHEAAIALRSAAPEVAVQSAWMHATCLAQLATKDKRQITSAINALQTFKQEFPASEEAARADVLVTRLRQSHADPQQALRELSAIKVSDASYVSAQYEICQLQYQLWAKVKSEPAKAEALAAELLKTVDRFLALAGTSGDERRLKATLLAVDVLLAARVPDYGRAASLLTNVAQIAEHLEPQNAAAVEYQYRRLQLAQNRGDARAVNAAADWITEHGAGTPYELPALVIVARAADQAVANAGGAERAARIGEATHVYSRLVALLGDSPAVLSSNKNAVAAAAKLAQYDEEQGNWSRAADRLERLAEALPRDRRLLRRAGLACYQSGRFSQALGHWRALLGGLESGTDDWLEAKYYQIACLRETDRANAEKAFAQFKVLFPDVKSAAWRPKFAELESRFP